MTTITTTNKRPITEEERKYQEKTLAKYRGSTGFVPTLQKISLESGTSVGTAAQFINGNSSNGKVRALLKARAIKKLIPMPPEVQKLLDIWKDTADTA